MISSLKLWASNIIVAVTISIIIEMLLPEGNNKKYVKVITGIYILYVIVSPVFRFISGNELKEIQEKFLKKETLQTYSDINVAETYILSLENALKESIEAEGYQVNYIQFYITENYSEIVKIEIVMKTGTEFNTQTIINKVLESYKIDKENIIIK